MPSQMISSYKAQEKASQAKKEAVAVPKSEAGPQAQGSHPR